MSTGGTTANSLITRELVIFRLLWVPFGVPFLLVLDNKKCIRGYTFCNS